MDDLLLGILPDAGNVLHARRALRRERVFRDRQSPLDAYNDDELVARYRFDRQHILEMVDALSDRIGPWTERSHAIPATLQVLIALRYYALGSMQLVVADTVGVSQPTVSRVVIRVTQAINGVFRGTISLAMDADAMVREKQRFFQIDGFPNVLGVIDGTHVPIHSPTGWGGNEHEYVNRKGRHSINVQVIFNAASELINVVARWPGSVHDSRILRNSNVWETFEHGRLSGRGVLLGDSGYPCLDWLLPPYRNACNQAQERLNV